MKNWKDSIISEAAQRLNSSIETITLESATLPIHIQKSLEPTTGASLQVCILNFTQAIREQRQAEYEFFKSHPELNP